MQRIQNKKVPYSFSIRADLIEDISYMKKTVENSKIDQQVENFLRKIVPARNE